MNSNNAATAFRRILICLIVVSYFHANSSWMAACADEEGLLARPIAVVQSYDEQSVLIASKNRPVITVVNKTTLKTRQIKGDWSNLVDMTALPGTNTLVAALASPKLLLIIDTADQSLQTAVATLPLDSVPAKVAVSPDGRFACVSMTWDHSLRIVPLQQQTLPDADAVTKVSLNFQPKQLLALTEQRFLVADAFGGKLAIVDAGTAAVVSQHELAGHHIGGLTLDSDAANVLITHQRVSRIAQTNRDDIHWGTLMQNGVTTIAQKDLLNPTKPPGRRQAFRQLGDAGNGAGDPAGLATWANASFAVAIAGTDQVAVCASNSEDPVFVDVGRLPTQVIALRSNQLLCINSLDDTASIIDIRQEPVVSQTLGKPRKLITAVDHGEVAYFSAAMSHDGWMSCNSCHVDGHSSDRLVDTLGDGHFGNPKRIPSLLNVARTGPWGWDGSKSSLQQQVTQTLQKTMHRKEPADGTGDSNEAVATHIIAYMNTLPIPQQPIGNVNSVTAGRRLFDSLSCHKCHDPKQHFTSPGTYNVQVTDESGQTLFNPPSLEGLFHRRSFFHDSRFRSIDELLNSHPTAQKSESLTQEDRTNLKAFLFSLPGR